MKLSFLAVVVFCVVLGVAIGLALQPLASAGHSGQVALWLEVAHRVATAIGGLGTFVALIIVLRQFYFYCNRFLCRILPCLILMSRQEIRREESKRCRSWTRLRPKSS